MASKQQGNASSSGKQGKSASPRPSTTTNSAGDMSVREAGHKGGQRVRELVGEGRQSDRRH